MLLCNREENKGLFTVKLYKNNDTVSFHIIVQNSYSHTVQKKKKNYSQGNERGIKHPFLSSSG